LPPSLPSFPTRRSSDLVHLLVQNQMLRFAPVQPDRTLQTYLSAPSQATLNSLPYFLAGNTDTGFYLGGAAGNSSGAQRNPILGPDRKSTRLNSSHDQIS